MIHSSKKITIPSLRNLHKIDANGNNILHQCVLSSLQGEIPLDTVQQIISADPSLVTWQNNEGLIPAQLLETKQLHLQSANRPLRRLLTETLPESAVKESLRRKTEITLTEHIPAFQNEGIDFKYVPSTQAPTLLQKPTLLCFSGRGTFEMPLIVGFMRKINASLNITDIPLSGAQVLCARYPGNFIDLTNDWKLTRKSPTEQQSTDHPMLYVRPFIHRYLRPLYLDKSDKRISTQQAMKNMRLLTLYGYSYGTAVIQMLADELSRDLNKYGYSEPESVLIQSQILTFQMGADLNPENYHNYLRQYHLLNTRDEVVFDRVRPLLPSIPEKAPDLIQTHLKDAPNQTVLLVNTISFNNEDTPHHTNTYCNETTEVQKRVKLWKNSILFNGLNNSVQNATGKRFIPLPKQIEMPPQRLLFTKNQTPLSLLLKKHKLICKKQKIATEALLRGKNRQRH